MQTSNVTHVSKFNPFPDTSGSKLYFPVVARANAWVDREGGTHKINKYKSLIRMNADNTPQFLANVGNNYKLVNNRELFPHVEQRMMTQLPRNILDGVTVSDQMAHNGRDCYREYIFPNLKCDIGAGGDVAFRLIIGNSYGGKAVSLICGAIDFWCSNGMIVGTHEKTIRRHTSGLSLNGLDEWITNSIEYFTKHGERLQRWNGDKAYSIGTQSDDLYAHLVKTHVMSDTQATAIRLQTIEECRTRSNTQVTNMWHMYSALTQWASHSDVRKTDNDHEVNTRIYRTRHAETVINAVERYMLRAA